MIAALCRSVHHDTRAWGWIKLFIALQCIISLCSCEFYQFPAEATWLLISSTVLICTMASLFLCLYSLDFSVPPIHNSWHTKFEPDVVVAEASTYLSIVSSSEFEGWYHSSWWIGTCAWKYLHVIDLQRLFFLKQNRVKSVVYQSFRLACGIVIQFNFSCSILYQTVAI